MKTQITNLIEKYKIELKAIESNYKISWEAKTQAISILEKIISDLENEFKKAKDEKCENCKHFSEGRQPDGFRWHKCEFDFNCSVVNDNLFEVK